MQYIDQLVSKRGDVLPDLHDVILRNSDLVPSALFGGHVPADQHTHHCLVFLASLFAGLALCRRIFVCLRLIYPGIVLKRQ